VTACPRKGKRIFPGAAYFGSGAACLPQAGRAEEPKSAVSGAMDGVAPARRLFGGNVAEGTSFYPSPIGCCQDALTYCNKDKLSAAGFVALMMDRMTNR